MAILARFQKGQYVVLQLGDGNGVATSTPFDALERVNRLLRENSTLIDQIDTETPGVKWPNVKTVAINRLGYQS